MIEDGDIISLDVLNRSLHVNITDKEIEERKQTKKANVKFETRGYVHLFQHHVEQAHLGADFEFLRGGSGSVVTKG